MRNFTIKTFYAFSPISETELPAIYAEITENAISQKVLGLMIMGKEGMNTTLACESSDTLNAFIQYVIERLQLKEVSLIKTSSSEKRPFKRFDIKIRPEIVTIGNENIVPGTLQHKHLSPEDWHQMMLNGDVVIVDTRNDYETKIGKFKNAIELDIKEFRDFPDKMKALETDREKPHMIYCTGGIRCEKAIYELESQGFKNVYQLEGGILNYIEKFPNGLFEGECFVFDARVAVDQNLQPSQKYSLCPHCGDVSTEEITCLKCDHPSKLCDKCYELSETQKDLHTCSKNCRHHYQLRPDRKGPHQKQYFNF